MGSEMCIRDRSNPFKRNVYLSGDVKILGSMVNLEFVVTLQ